MRASSIYPGGPSRASGDPLTDSAEVREARRRLGPVARLVHDGILGPEQFETHEEYMAERDRELWGDAPFEED